jgi:hypothetical protein
MEQRNSRAEGVAMKGISAALAIAALAAAPAPAAADPALPGVPLRERPSYPDSRRDLAADQTVAIALGGVLLFVVIAGPFFGAESRPAWRNVDRKPSFRMVGSMRPEDWT